MPELLLNMQEGDMPIEDLLAMYGYDSGGPPPVSVEPHDTRSSSEEEILSNQVGGTSHSVVITGLRGF